MEINTAGMRRTQSAPYPAQGILPLAAAHGLPVITGSDAHEPHLVGFGFSEVRGWIEAVPGLRQARYRGRKRQPAEPLSEIRSRALAG